MLSALQMIEGAMVQGQAQLTLLVEMAEPEGIPPLDNLETEAAIRSIGDMANRYARSPAEALMLLVVTARQFSREYVRAVATKIAAQAGQQGQGQGPRVS